MAPLHGILLNILLRAFAASFGFPGPTASARMMVLPHGLQSSAELSAYTQKLLLAFPCHCQPPRDGWKHRCPRINESTHFVSSREKPDDITFARQQPGQPSHGLIVSRDIHIWNFCQGLQSRLPTKIMVARPCKVATSSVKDRSSRAAMFSVLTVRACSC